MFKLSLAGSLQTLDTKAKSCATSKNNSMIKEDEKLRVNHIPRVIKFSESTINFNILLILFLDMLSKFKTVSKDKSPTQVTNNFYTIFNPSTTHTESIIKKSSSHKSSPIRVNEKAAIYKQLEELQTQLKEKNEFIKLLINERNVLEKKVNSLMKIIVSYNNNQELLNKTLKEFVPEKENKMIHHLTESVTSYSDYKSTPQKSKIKIPRDVLKKTILDKNVQSISNSGDIFHSHSNNESAPLNEQKEHYFNLSHSSGDKENTNYLLNKYTPPQRSDIPSELHKIKSRTEVILKYYYKISKNSFISN